MSITAAMDTLTVNMKWFAGVALTYFTALITLVQFIKR